MFTPPKKIMHNNRNLFLRLLTVAAFVVAIFTSCSKTDYRAAIPMGSTMLASVNLTDEDAAADLSFLTHYLKMSDPLKSGIDVTKKIYFFESADGNFGLCASVSSESNLQGYVETLKQHGLLKDGPERDHVKFAIIAEKFVAAYSHEVILIMGPVLPSAQKDMMQQLANCLEQDESESMLGTQLMAKLDEQKGSIAMVARATALPQQVSHAFALGAPKGTDLSDVAFAANLDIRDDMLVIESEPFSDDAAVEAQLKKSYSGFRQINDTFLRSMSRHDLMGLFLNVDGKKLMHLLQQSEGTLAMLTGINQAIDMNAIIQSFNGDVYIGMPQYDADKTSIKMGAMLGNSQFLNDVAYWKSSVPQGAQLTDWQPNAYCYSSPDISFCFGVRNYTPLQFYAGTTKEQALSIMKPADTPLEDSVINTVKGTRFAIVVSLAALLPADGGIATMMLPSMMKVKSIVYTVK